MAESALARLLRLKKEKENGSSTLAEIQGKEPEVGSGNPSAQVSECASSGGTILSEEGIHPDGATLPVSFGSEHVAESVVVPEVVASSIPPKPMSAMDRLRALKSGVKQDGGVPASSTGSMSGSNSSGNNPANVVQQSQELIPASPPKPRKTHPIAMEMAELEEALNAQVPGFVTILSQIHKKLRADPDVVTLLDDEEIGVIVAGLERHTNVTIVAPSAVKAAKSKARKEPVTAMDL